MKRVHQHRDIDGRVNGFSHPIDGYHSNPITRSAHNWTLRIEKRVEKIQEKDPRIHHWLDKVLK